MSDRLFQDRRDAGRTLAGLLDHYRGREDVVVLGLPRGGVPVAYEVARALGAPLDVFVVRKLGVPGHEEVAMGAIASGGVVVINDDVVRGLGITPEVIQRVAEQEGRELLRREQAYRDGRPMPELTDKTVILVDDGLATGSSMHAAIIALREHKPGRIVVAVPAAPKSTCQELSALVDEVICATTPSPFLAVGAWYWDFSQTTDEEVRDLLRAAATSVPARTAERTLSDTDVIRSAGIPTEEGVPSDDALFELVGDAHIVLLGEASHGTGDFYAARAAMTRRLVEEKGFCAVAAEADWPDAYRVNRYVRGRGEDADAEEALRGFQRFPTWMWRNAVVLDFVGWLRERNDRIDDERRKAGFYGLDLYSLYRSIDEVITYLDRVDPAAAQRARERYGCFDHYGTDDGQTYGLAAALGAGETCEQEVIDQLVDLQRHGLEYARRDGLLAEDEQFYAEQNALVVRNAAEYYRSMFSGRALSWNLRDRHMVETLDAVQGHLTRQLGDPAKIVVWEHNSHLGDARATEMAARGELNVGQLVRERHAGDCRNLGFTTYTGTVTAADDWGGEAQRKWVRPALPGSIEELFHEVGQKEFMLSFATATRAAEVLRPARLERAIGVIYRPETERASHYFRARVADQFDAVIHIDDTRAVEPLERTALWETGEVPETYPFAV
ncbi:erythromycin esterase family protein (plasmid) [Pseudonocardia bannensis]|uniref:Erythromycin esterase n=1 Tax=Pseudonocardia bannensis TaxID=630973 RepID=A0A848DRG8_9PSEU|nr:erythromycin esterase family protein [Pseudonocardia bannensis]NMH94874.1 erythromycin esterase [Pseudonocardia bannensis]